MSANISIPKPPRACVLCGARTDVYGDVAVLQGLGDEDGPVCHDCLWSLAGADDPCEWLLTEARARESRAVGLQGSAERLRRLAERGLEVPSHKDLEAARANDDDAIPF